MKVKDILAVEIKNIVEKHKASFAFLAHLYTWKKINEICINLV